MLQLVVDVSGIQRFLSLPQDELLLLIILYFGIPAVTVFMAWMAGQLWLGNRQEKFLGKVQSVVLAIDVPAMSEQSPKAVENIFAILKGTKSVITLKEKWIFGKLLRPTSFEVVSIDGYIQFYVRVNTFHRDLIEAGIYTQYPDAEITEVDDYTQNLPDDFPNDTHELFGGEITLDHDNYLPIKTYEDFEHMPSKDQKLKDPLINMFELMSRLKHGEQFWVHMIVFPAGDGGWIKKGEEFMLKTFGKDIPKKKSTFSKLAGPLAWIPSEAAAQVGNIFAGAAGEDAKQDSFKIFNMTNSEKAQLDSTSKKLSKQGYLTKIRWAYVARHEVYNKGGRNSLWKGYINLYSHPDGNKFTYNPDTMPRDDYFYLIWEYRAKQRMLMSALKGRSFAKGSNPMYLNVEELATLWHFPTIDVKAPLIKKTEARRGEAPTYLPTAGFGESDELSSSALVEVDEQGRPIEPKVEAVVDDTDEIGVANTTPIDGLDDILPSEPLVEEAPVAPVAPEALDNLDDDQPFVPPNLPI